MCGICGIVDFAGEPTVQTAQDMTLSMRHRGPDAEGTYSFPSCVMGHRRLSIIDLSNSADQPMVSADGLTALVFNGEIYNFRELRQRLEGKGCQFRTRSDTEVLLQLYQDKQEAMLSDINGMFSFAIWDDRRKRLFMARDRMGKKPLYYTREGSRLSFSSELSSLLMDPAVVRDISEQALFEYLMYDFIPAPHTIFRDVYKLPAAHMAIFDENGLVVKSYWSHSKPEADLDYCETRTDLEELLQDSVSLRLVSDVPLGAFLSGGIDSTLVTSFMCDKSDAPINTFSISFPHTTYDESHWSRMAADFLGTSHQDFPSEYDVEQVFPQLVRHFGEPFGDSSAVPTWRLCFHTRQKVTVALSGDGGDELFGGYERYLARRFQLVYDCLPASLRKRIIEPMLNCLPETTDYYGTSFLKKLKLFVRASSRMESNPLALVPGTFSAGDISLLTGIEYRMEKDPVITVAREWVGVDPVTHMMFTDMQTYLAEDILTKVDRMSMAHSLEVRCPLLDYRLVELASRMPILFKIHRLTTKRILRDAAKSRVPAPILKRPKHGFQIPLGARLKGHLKKWAEERVCDFSHHFFRKDVVAKLWDEHQIGRADHAFKIWLILFFNEWYAQFCD